MKMNKKMLLITVMVIGVVAMAEPKTSVLCDTPFGVIYEGETAVMRLQDGASASNLYWRLSDWRGNKVRQGVWPISGVLPLEGLPTGHYTLTPRYGDKTDLREATVTVLERMDESLPRDSYLAIMSALAYITSLRGEGLGKGRGDYPWYDGNGMRAHAEVLGKLGINTSREIFLWNEEERVKGKVNLPANERQCVELLRQQGVKIAGYNQSTPLWATNDARIAGRNATRALTRDYKALYDHYKWLTETLGEDAASIEHWNEEDICGDEPAWEYAASMKAAYLGIKAANRNRVVMQGPFCRKPFEPYNRLVMANDVAKYSDVFNYHSYCSLVNIPGYMEGIRKMLAEAGCPNRAIWMTEINSNHEGNSKEQSVRTKYKQHSREQELIVTEFTLKELILYRMQGVAKNFWFVLCAMNEREGAKDWGMTRRDGSMKRCYAAMATAVRRLGFAKLEGRVDLGDQRAVGYSFRQPDGSQTLVVWAKSPIETAGMQIKIKSDCAQQLVVRAPVTGEVAVYDTCGARRTERFEDGRLLLDIDRYATIVTGLKGLVAVEKPLPVGKVEMHEFATDEDPTIVVCVNLDKPDFSIGGNKSMAEIQNDNPKAKVVVWNLSDRVKRGSLTVANAQFEGLPESFEVPAWGKAEFTTTMRVAKPPKDEFVTTVTIAGNFEGKRISRLVMKLRNVMALFEDAVEVRPDLSRKGAWHKNDSARKTAFVWDETEQAMRIDVEWDADDVDCWAYEAFCFDLPKEQCEGLLVAEFEVKMRQDKVENDVDWSYVYVNTGKTFGHHKSTPYKIDPPRDAWEKRRVGINPAQAKDVLGLQFGCNPKGRKMSYWVRNLKLIKAK